MTTLWVLVAQLAASSAMAAIAWFVQQVHYPLFAFLLPSAPAAEEPSATLRCDAVAYHDENVRRTRPVVLVPMGVEAATAAWLACSPPDPIGRPAALVGLALVAVVILSTALVQVPLHARLRSPGASRGTIDALVRSTGLRTLAWSLRAALAAWMLAAFAAR